MISLRAKNPLHLTVQGEGANYMQERNLVHPEEICTDFIVKLWYSRISCQWPLDWVGMPPTNLTIEHLHYSIEVPLINIRVRSQDGLRQSGR